MMMAIHGMICVRWRLLLRFAPSLIDRIPGSDDLMLIWNWHWNWKENLAGIRCPLAIGLSHDGGDTWLRSERKILEDDPAYTYAYPSALMLD